MNRCSAIGVLLAVIGSGPFPGAVAMEGGERPIWLDLRGLEQPAPVSAGELQAALALRVPLVTEPTAGAVAVVVTSPEAGQLDITAEGRLRRVELGAATGVDAARLVALIVVDVVRSGIAPLPAPASVVGTAAARPTPAPAGSRWAVAASVGMGIRTTDAGPGLAPGLELRLALGGRGRVFLSSAFERAEIAIDGGGARDGVVGMSSVPVRAGAGLRLGWAEVRAGAVARPYWLAGTDSQSGTLWGGFVAGVAELPSRGPLAAFAVAGLDLVPRPVAFLVGDQRILTFRTLAPFVAVGGVWRGRRG